MNCQKFETIANELSRGRMMEAEIRNEATAHSADCQGCASLLRDEGMLTRGLQSLATGMSSLEAPVAVEDRLMSAFRQRQVVVPMPVRRNYRKYWLTAVAALLLVVIGLVAYGLKSNRDVAPSTPVQAVAPQQDQNQQLAQEQSQPQPQVQDQDKVEVRHPNKPHRRPVNRNSFVAQSRASQSKNETVSHHPEVATDFMPIGYMNAATFQDGGQIIRVEVPRSRLASFGIPVNMDRYNERIKADILISADGMARAIRFVQDKRLD